VKSINFFIIFSFVLHISGCSSSSQQNSQVLRTPAQSSDLMLIKDSFKSHKNIKKIQNFTELVGEAQQAFLRFNQLDSEVSASFHLIKIGPKEFFMSAYASEVNDSTTFAIYSKGGEKIISGHLGEYGNSNNIKWDDMVNGYID
jgi:hypothetical protein